MASLGHIVLMKFSFIYFFQTTRAYNVVTALAGLTDHLPVSLTVDVAH